MILSLSGTCGEVGRLQGGCGVCRLVVVAVCGSYCCVQRQYCVHRAIVADSSNVGCRVNVSTVWCRLAALVFDSSCCDMASVANAARLVMGSPGRARRWPDCAAHITLDTGRQNVPASASREEEANVFSPSTRRLSEPFSHSRRRPACTSAILGGWL